MTDIQRIGEGHFATPLELLPNERVLWTGGALPRASLVLLARHLTIWVMPALFLISMIVITHKLDRDDEPTPPPAQAQAQSHAKECPRPQATASCPQAKPVPAKPKPEPTARKATQPEQSGWGVGAFVIGAFVVVPLLFVLAWALGTLVDSVLRIRRAWYVITSERVCILSGGFSQTLAVMDLDKVISVKSYATWFEKSLGLQSIELTHASGTTIVTNGWGQFINPSAYAIAYVPAKSPLLSELLNHWLPRDDRRR